MKFQAAHNLRKERSKTNLREKSSTQAVLNNALDLRVTDSEGSVETVSRRLEHFWSWIAKFSHWNLSSALAQPLHQLSNSRRPRGRAMLMPSYSTICYNKSESWLNSKISAIDFQVRFIAEHFRHNEKESEVSDDWVYAANVLDRLFLIIFSVLNVATSFIILEVRVIFRNIRPPLTLKWPLKILIMVQNFIQYDNLLDRRLNTSLQAPSLYDRSEPLNITVPSKPLGMASLFNAWVTKQRRHLHTIITCLVKTSRNSDTNLTNS